MKAEPSHRSINVRVSLKSTVTALITLLYFAFPLTSMAQNGNSAADSNPALEQLSALSKSDSHDESPNSGLGVLESYSAPQFLPKEEAFKGEIELFNQQILVNWTIADEYYLYKERFKFEITDSETARLGVPEFSQPGKMKDDENFGRVEVYYHNVAITIPIEANPQESIEISVGYQGCAEAGLCYPPSKLKKRFEIPDRDQSTHNTATAEAAKPTLNQPTAEFITEEPLSASSAKPTQIDTTNVNSIASYLSEASLIPMLGLFFLLGIGLTFTPCVLPMVPILSSVVLGQKTTLTPLKGFLLSSSYVLGMALAFSLAGLLVGLSGQRVQIYMQNPYVLSTFATIFVLLSLSMFGFYELQLPSKLRDKLNTFNDKQSGGHLAGVFIMGALSALVVSPCVSAPLAGILIFIATEGNALLGAAALLSLGLGMGAPLIALTTTGANFLPKAGSWMNTTKTIFGIALLAVAAYLVRTVLPSPIMMLIWSGLIIIPAIYMGALDPLEPSASGWQKLWKGIGIMMLVFGAAIIWGAAKGSTNPLQPLEQRVEIGSAQSGSQRATLPFNTVTTLEALSKHLDQARQQQQPVMIDYYADWCIACVEMEHGAFLDPQVQKQLADFTLIKVDITEVGERSDQLLDHFNLIGPPSILFFNPDGKRLSSADIVGEMNAKQLLEHINGEVLPLIN